MNPLNQVNIVEVSTEYDVRLKYHSDIMAKDYDVIVKAIEDIDGRISIEPATHGGGFQFIHSDPDRVIAIAQMMMSFAQMVKKNNQKSIDTPADEC